MDREKNRVTPPSAELPPASLAYRPDLDGLRAIAVLAVVLFHLQFRLPGGFVGVDIFFVLSGFLITSIIRKDAASAEGFSILKFWERRIRRILPALLVVILVTVIGGWFIFLPSDFAGLGKSLLAQAVFGGNFYFWLSSGYFEAAANLKPLLHTWSLAVEEQFYLLFPLLFLVRSHWKTAALGRVIGLTALVSLGLGVALARYAPSAGFYLLPARAWELFGGALLALTSRTTNVPRWLREILGWAGLLAIGVACRFYNDRTPFPGMAALLPCLGTMALIWANGLSGPTPTLARLLSLCPAVCLGKISYSLYLWHWPICVFAVYLELLDAHFFRLGALGLSIALAAISWKWIETPFRTRQIFPRRSATLGFGVASLAGCGVVGALLMASRGMPGRFSENILRCDAARWDYPIKIEMGLATAQSGAFPRVGLTNTPVRCLVWGDSHAMAIKPALDKLAAEYASSVEFATHSVTAPALDYASDHPLSLGRDSKAWSDAVVAAVRRQKIPNVVLAARWTHYIYWETSSHDQTARKQRELAEKLAATVTALQQSGTRVWLLKDVPVQPENVPFAMARELMWKRPPAELGETKKKFTDNSRLEDEILAPAIARGARVLDPGAYFFTNRDTGLVEASGQIIYRDEDHLSRDGALMIADLFRPIWTAP